ncbi:MAG: threonine/serine dehydratase [Thermoplasmata archaeon]|nr:threonine/serine dehydratase [Thermoplasmata archaeon]
MRSAAAPVDVRSEVLAACERIRGFVRETPLEYSAHLSLPEGPEVHLKLENTQLTGSFKVRGAFNKLLSMSDEERARGVVTASSGNHGAAMALAMAKTGTEGMIFLPEDAVESKVETIRSLGADIRYHGTDCGITEAFARRFAHEEGMVYVSPYNDPKVIGGQGTIAAEIVRQLDGVDSVFVSVGGGGLISGIAGFLKSVDARIEIVGCLPENSPVMAESVKAGRLLDMGWTPTISDATAGLIEEGAMTFDLCSRYVDDFELVSESEISEAMRLVISKHHMLIEGAAGVSVASLLKRRGSLEGKKVVVVLCGANVGVETLRSVICGSE